MHLFTVLAEECVGAAGGARAPAIVQHQAQEKSAALEVELRIRRAAARSRRRGHGSLEAVSYSVRDATFIVLFEAARKHLVVFPIQHLMLRIISQLLPRCSDHESFHLRQLQLPPSLPPALKISRLRCASTVPRPASAAQQSPPRPTVCPAKKGAVGLFSINYFRKKRRKDTRARTVKAVVHAVHWTPTSSTTPQ